MSHNGLQLGAPKQTTYLRLVCVSRCKKETLIKTKKMDAIKTNVGCWFDTKKVINPPIGTKVDFMTKYGHFYYGEIINRHSVGVFYVAGFGYFENSIVEKWKYSKQ